MHHVENNVFEEDLSSTEPYQRDSFVNFLIYYFRYWTHIFILPIYAIKKERYELAITAICGVFFWLFTIIYGC